ncbi:MAG: NUDIX domain-containing protein [Spirochaetaceae bacterium]|jgi:8-oxo-dGTP diphosphatase|nr:NUDIX domain-containing protein [Spirochaetaceae bacterium]
MKLRNSVAGIALRGKDLFIARRLPGGDQGGKWEFPGGKVREGESDQDALIREFEEELRAPVEVLSYLASAEFIHGDTRFTLRAYRVTLLCESFTLSVHSRWRWASFAELKTLDFADSDRLLFPALDRAFAL